jgi:hypothetical protein
MSGNEEGYLPDLHAFKLASFLGIALIMVDFLPV